MERSVAKPVRCQKCGKPIGYVSVLSRSVTPFQQPVPNVKIVAICMECSRKKEDSEARHYPMAKEKWFDGRR